MEASEHTPGVLDGGTPTAMNGAQQLSACDGTRELFQLMSQKGPQGAGLLFDDDQLHQGGGIEIDRQRSSSLILASRAEADWPRGILTLGGPRSFRLPMARVNLPAASSRSRRVPLTGTNFATGRPRTVTSMLSPRRTRSTVAAAFCWSCLTPMLSKCGTVAQDEVYRQAGPPLGAVLRTAPAPTRSALSCRPEGRMCGSRRGPRRPRRDTEKAASGRRSGTSRRSRYVKRHQLDGRRRELMPLFQFPPRINAAGLTHTPLPRAPRARVAEVTPRTSPPPDAESRTTESFPAPSLPPSFGPSSPTRRHRTRHPRRTSDRSSPP